ncbi:DNA polymerase IV [Leptospira ryugenii]|uniref:DNA polymerase IV n=1 Tax=Leptospira ryugenii TaxID=1917863 RepID=A0A2P2E557_9LEPT|nr:DNA polymerase IV [Leptospira ryugenii]GBF52013.1 DNA polymerase IV [Leptospira ryugenii]
MTSSRKIIHIDMDAFYASVEQRDRPEWKGKPVVVGGSPHSRGVVCAASYEARTFGIRSAMPCYRAYQLCPTAIFTAPRFDVYKQISKEIREIFFEYTDLVEPLSLDEAYLDVTTNKRHIPHASTIAKEIRRKVFEKTSLTCSAGVASTKFLAKMASEKNKPNGLCVILPEETESFLSDLSLSQFHGIGQKTALRLKELGYERGRDLLNVKEEELIKLFGKMGKSFFQMMRGIDDRPVVPYREAKSIGVETTFLRDSSDLPFLLSQLNALSEELALRMEKKQRQGKTITIKVKYSDFMVRSKSQSFSNFLYLAHDLFEQSSILFTNLWNEDSEHLQKIRLLGISISNLNSKPKNEDGQLELFSV